MQGSKEWIESRAELLPDNSPAKAVILEAVRTGNFKFHLAGVVQNRSAELNNFDFKPGELLFASGIDVPSK
ncbi:hypothetical protein [Catenovulum sediminis]|uniref:Uncharacterized protein n=1 Tax=Catenovulum sediminis TaxID=1740262 RepID=A0ABV1RFS1_9ALTE